MASDAYTRLKGKGRDPTLLPSVYPREDALPLRADGLEAGKLEKVRMSSR